MSELLRPGQVIRQAKRLISTVGALTPTVGEGVTVTDRQYDNKNYPTHGYFNGVTKEISLAIPSTTDPNQMDTLSIVVHRRGGPLGFLTQEARITVGLVRDEGRNVPQTIHLQNSRPALAAAAEMIKKASAIKPTKAA